MADSALGGYRAVLFDALGTLVELEPPWPLLRTVLRRRHAIEVSEDAAKAAMLAEMAYYRAHHHEGSTEEALVDLRLRCAEILRERLPAVSELGDPELVEALLDSLSFVPYRDAAPALAGLRAGGFRLAVVSNWDCSLRSTLARLGLEGAIDEVVVSAQAGALKPDPAIFSAALERLRCAPRDAVFVGDSLETDVAGARSAGIRALLLDRNPSAPNGDDIERIYSLSELVELVAARA